MTKLTNKVAIITGAAAGLGEGIASVYAKYGAKIVIDGGATLPETVNMGTG